MAEELTMDCLTQGTCIRGRELMRLSFVSSFHTVTVFKPGQGIYKIAVLLKKSIDNVHRTYNTIG